VSLTEEQLQQLALAVGDDAVRSSLMSMLRLSCVRVVCAARFVDP
jgi:hypothetical protein